MTRKLWIIPVLAATLLLFTSQARSIPAAPPVLGGCTVLPADNIWNVPVDNLPAAADSSTYINAIGASSHMHADFGSGDWPPGSGAPIGIPFVVVSQTQPLVNINWTAYGDESDPGPYPVPTAAPIEGGAASDGDRHVLVLRQGECKLYELYRAFPQNDGSWDADSGAVYTLTLNGPLRPAGWTSADAAGLPMLPGLVRYDEVASGEIDHAIRFTANNSANAYVWPARHKAPYNTQAGSPPMGQRFRLKASFSIDNRFSPQVQVILRALKKYGLILADNGSSWYLSGAPDERWNNDDLHALDTYVSGSDFEAVDVSSLQVNPDSGQVVHDFTLQASPSARSIDPGGSTSFQLQTAVHGYWANALTVMASSPSPSVTIGLSGSIVAVPGSITLIVTDTHPIGSPAIWYTIPITATGSSVTHYASVSVLVGGRKVYLPLLWKN